MDNITKNSFSSLQIIGANVKTLRIMRNLSQEVLAEKIDKSINFISLLENGKTGLSVQTIIDLCSALQVDANFIFRGVIAPPEAMADDYIIKSLTLFNDTDKAMVTDLITYIVNSKS